jgi:hypothetical protein
VCLGGVRWRVFGARKVMWNRESDVSWDMCRFEPNRDDVRFTCHITHEKEYPSFLKRAFNKYIFGKAKCISCSQVMTSLSLGRLAELSAADEKDQQKSMSSLTCSCGSGKWHIGQQALFSAQNSIRKDELSWHRKQWLKLSGGRHNDQQIVEILTLQNNRCIYCDSGFSGDLLATKDHIIPVTYGGSDWAFNIVMACRSCNSRRGDIPFRTFCQLLSPTQNKKVFKHLMERIRVLDLYPSPEDAISSFDIALRLHDRKNVRYQQILSDSANARKNRSMNKLLPRSCVLVVEKQIAMHDGSIKKAETR